jgi:cold-inducible RNA-binding protein
MSRLFVGNLSFGVNEEVLAAFIREFGIEVSKVDIIRDSQTGRSRGFGFVDLAQGISADAAINALNGKNLEGRALNVNMAHDRNSRPQRDLRRGTGRAWSAKTPT